MFVCFFLYNLSWQHPLMWSHVLPPFDWTEENLNCIFLLDHFRSISLLWSLNTNANEVQVSFILPGWLTLCWKLSCWMPGVFRGDLRVLEAKSWSLEAPPAPHFHLTTRLLCDWNDEASICCALPLELKWVTWSLLMSTACKATFCWFYPAQTTNHCVCNGDREGETNFPSFSNLKICPGTFYCCATLLEDKWVNQLIPP